MATSLSLPGDRTISLASDVQELLRGGVLVADPVRVETSAALTAETEEVAERLRAQYAGKRPAEIPALQEARHLYRLAGMDPTRTRPSSEALLRRVLKGRSLYVISNAVDACNLASLSFLLPIGLYDLDRIEGDIVLRLGRPGEEYPGIRKGPVHVAGRLALFDARGPFGSPTSDSSRTCVTDGTCRLLAVIMATASYPARDLREHTALLADLLERHCAGTLVFQAVLPEGEPVS